jgi:hypothetical protein
MNHKYLPTYPPTYLTTYFQTRELDFQNRQIFVQKNIYDLWSNISKYVVLFASEISTVLDHGIFGFPGLVLWRPYAIQTHSTLFIIIYLQLYIRIWH